MMQPKFSILIVCLNPGDKIRITLDSIRKQTFLDYEIVIKDGLSDDGSLAFVEELQKKSILYAEENEGMLRLIRKKDEGIYDAMNQAVEQARGEYLYFLNCGDAFYDRNVLAVMAELIDENPFEQGIYYGNIFERVTGQVVSSNPRLTAFGCYRNVPCHQACFYERKLLLDHPFDTRYRVRADYEQFLWCFFTKKYEEGVLFYYGDMLVADYEGGGFSETPENRKLSEKEHQEIVSRYMSRVQILWYKLLMLLTLAPLRRKLAQNQKTAGVYNRLKRMLYGGEEEM